MTQDELLLFRELTHEVVNLRAAQRGYMQLRTHGSPEEKDRQGRLVAERANKVDEVLAHIRKTLPDVWSVQNG